MTLYRFIRCHICNDYFPRIRWTLVARKIEISAGVTAARTRAIIKCPQCGATTMDCSLEQWAKEEERKEIEERQKAEQSKSK